MKKFLVAARIDRSGKSVSRGRIKKLMQESGFDSYFETSAKTGLGVAELSQAIRNGIDWDLLAKVSSTGLFQRIKSFLLDVKEARRQLTTIDDLYYSFLNPKMAPDIMVQDRSRDLRSQFEACVGLLESRDLVRRFRFGNLILLQPELLDAYASALVNAVKDEPDGLGLITENEAREGKFFMPADERIKDSESEKLLLIAMIEDLLRRELILREDPYLIFPSQSTRENPD
jgi:hypothetical protein